MLKIEEKAGGVLLERIVRLDDLDRAILNALQKDATAAYKDLSKIVGAPESTVYDRVKRLRSLRVIRDMIPLIDFEKCGKLTTAFIRISIEPVGEIHRIASSLATFEDVLEVHEISGEWDILIKVKVKDNKELRDLEANKIGQIKGIKGLYSLICIGTEKEDVRMRL